MFVRITKKADNPRWWYGRRDFVGKIIEVRDAVNQFNLKMGSFNDKVFEEVYGFKFINGKGNGCNLSVCFISKKDCIDVDFEDGNNQLFASKLLKKG